MDISIIIPVYNKAEYLDQCFKTLLQQDFNNFEILCVNDGSTDGSGAICDEWAIKDNRISVIHKENGGVTAARYEGVMRARSKYIMFVDADDGLLPGALQTMYDAIRQSGADEVIAPFCTYQGIYSPIVYKGFTPVEPLIRSIITSKNRFPVLWSIIYRRELLIDIFDIPRDIIEGEDKLMQVKLLMKQPRVFFITDYIYKYNLGLPNSRRRTLEREKLYDQLLRQVLTPRWEDYHSAFALHQLKEYERFIHDGIFSVRSAYYLDALRPLSKNIPLYDRLVFVLPPIFAQPIIKLYRKLITLKQKGL